MAALQFLSDDLGLALAPRVVAADVSAGFLVLEDLAPRVALDHLIRRDGAAAHLELLAAFARARGELSAATAGRAGTYHARRVALGSPAPVSEAEGRLAGHRALHHLAGWAMRTAGVLRRRWPDADLDLTGWARFPPYSARR